MRKRQERKIRMQRKAMRLKRYRSHFGRKAVKVFTSGPLPGHGCGVQGLTGGEAHSLRRVAASSIKPDAARRSLTVLSLLEGDPVRRGSVAPVLRYIKE
eukprot:5201032-Pyramimonas_sp.AAC.1